MLADFLIEYLFEICPIKYQTGSICKMKFLVGCAIVFKQLIDEKLRV
jgi:hypothetical protein